MRDGLRFNGKSQRPHPRRETAGVRVSYALRFEMPLDHSADQKERRKKTERGKQLDRRVVPIQKRDRQAEEIRELTRTTERGQQSGSSKTEHCLRNPSQRTSRSAPNRMATASSDPVLRGQRRIISISYLVLVPSRRRDPSICKFPRLSCLRALLKNAS